MLKLCEVGVLLPWHISWTYIALFSLQITTFLKLAVLRSWCINVESALLGPLDAVNVYRQLDSACDRNETMWNVHQRSKNIYKSISVHAMVVYRGSRGMALLFLILGIRWKWVLNFTPQPFYALETSPVPIKCEAGWAPVPVRTILRRGNTLLLAEIRTLDGPAHSLMAVTIAQHTYQISHSTHSPSKHKLKFKNLFTV
jgi:hypothetical protein